jgi:hypothetical protein
LVPEVETEDIPREQPALKALTVISLAEEVAVPALVVPPQVALPRAVSEWVVGWPATVAAAVAGTTEAVRGMSLLAAEARGL